MKNKKIENKLQQFFQLHHGWNGKFSLAPPKNNIQLISRIYDTITEWQHVVIEDVGVGDDGEVDLIWTIGDTRYYLTIHNSDTSEIEIITTKNKNISKEYTIDNHNYQVVLISNAIYSIIHDNE